MDILILVLVEIVRTFVREIVAYTVKVFTDKRKNEKKTTPKLRKGKKGGRSRKN